MWSSLDFESIRMAHREYLWLLLVPAALGAICGWALVRRWLEVRRFRREHVSAFPVRLSRIGDLGFWLTTLLAAAFLIVALARPQMTTTVVRRAAGDFIILQDGSASMYARDVAPDRWQRSVQFIRTFAEALSWRGDRVALALFAQRAAPQSRLTSDPNALFFFLDSLGERSPFRLEDDPTWDTNIEEGVQWGLRLVETNERLFGPNGNLKVFLVISDGQAWSGEVAKALAEVRRRQARLYVVGVGTVTGASIPTSSEAGASEPPIHTALDRESLRALASAGGGEYFEIGNNSDRDVAAQIIAAVRRRAGILQEVQSHADLYQVCLFAAAISLWTAALSLRDRTQLMWLGGGALGALLILANLLR